MPDAEPKANLIYTIAFDAVGGTGLRTQAEIMVRSLLATGWEGSVIVIRNTPAPIFPAELGVVEIFFDTGDLGSALKRAAQRFKFRAPNLIAAGGYDQIAFCDADSVWLKNPSPWFADNRGLTVMREEPNRLPHEAFSSHFTGREVAEHRGRHGLNSGFYIIRAEDSAAFHAAWATAANGWPDGTDQQSFNRVCYTQLLDRLQYLPFDQATFPVFARNRFPAYRGATLLHVCGKDMTCSRKIQFARALATLGVAAVAVPDDGPRDTAAARQLNLQGACGIVLAGLSLLWFAGCAAKRPLPLPPAPAVTAVAEARAAQAVVRQHLTPARARTETIIKTVETIRETADPATAAALGEVQAELFKVSADLRDALTAASQAETQIGVATRQADALRAWGIEQQGASAENAEGWRAEESAHGKTKAALKHQTGLARKWRLITAGVAALVAGFFVARQYFPFLKFL